MNLQNLLNSKNIEKITASVKDVKAKLAKAFRVFNYGKGNLSRVGDEDIVYGNIYDSIRLGCEAILLLTGHRVKSSSQSHHYETINAASILMSGELTNEFNRMQRMRKKRNKFEYGNLISISELELLQAIKDAKILLNRVDKLIEEKENQKPML